MKMTMLAARQARWPLHSETPPPPGNLFGKTRGSRPSSPGSNPMGLADEVQTSRKMVLLLEKGIRQLSLDFYSWDHLRIS